MAEFERVVIVGVGLLGGSIGLALRSRQLAGCVVGVGRRPAALHEALSRGAVDEVQEDLPAACRGADLAIVCTPVQQVVAYAVACQEHMPTGGLITDVGSTKRRICEALSSASPNAFCGSHPLAGSDKSGVEFASADLFAGRMTMVTPAFIGILLSHHHSPLRVAG